MYIKRVIEGAIKKTGDFFPCILLYGPRQCGKTTTLKMLFEDKIKIITLDDLENRTLARNNPRLFLENFNYPILIDEIQKAPNLLDEIKIRIDNISFASLKDNKKCPLMYVLTGSNRFELKKAVTESLAGRVGILDMLSLSLEEKYGYNSRQFIPNIEYFKENEKERKYISRKDIFENIFQGGMPDVVTGTSKREIYFKSYLNTYLEKDILSLISSSSETKFRNFLTLLALRTGCELHFDEIAKEVGVDLPTIKKWISILESSGIIYLLEPYMKNISNRIIKAPKLYFLDTGLCSYLCKWQDGEMLSFSTMSGAFFETFVVGEIIKNLYSFNIDPHFYLYYYRDIDKKEIDLLFVDKDTIYPIEIKKGIGGTKGTKNFNVLKKYNMNIGTGFVIDTSDKIFPINENVYTIPVYLI